ncbi:MFS general substrate transporter [Lophiostoma macrostomum CBS 122681]|uniref:MFS general substrate transporter n=1 Tax=Lophiostoma macrostomum CBS 122681 TaxID=1314788 RepID=A0A6A6T8B4_9PLEO|nr:MFS general substrate transporter [Lophiostoma macrostomum CBS 122681]
MPAADESHSDAGRPQETTPLLPRDAAERQYDRWVLYRALLCAFMVSLSFGVTQVPMLYVFRLMTCEAYYETHPEPDIQSSLDRCARHEIEAGTARAVALLSASTTIFGIMNLLVTGWSIKRFGVKPALVIQVFWPAARLAVQNIGVMAGSNAGIIIIQCSQIITIIGGPNGYVLALNALVTDITEHEARTGALGRLQGCMMVGSAVGFLVGGILGDFFGIITPFRITLILFVLCCLYVIAFLPPIPREKDTVAARQTPGLRRFFGPFRIFAPQKWILPNGHNSIQTGALTLGLGVFLSILATGYLSALLQLYSTNDFGFGTSENGLLIFIYSSLRGLYLSLVFPRIIAKGRKWLQPFPIGAAPDPPESLEEPDYGNVPTSPNKIVSVDHLDDETEPLHAPARDDEQETFAFDLLYARWSIFIDCIMTGLATFVSQGWQLYLVAVLLPFAAGTGAASKGSILQMLPKSERLDALSGMTLVENLARLSTTALFGLVFAALAEVGKSYLVFTCNAAVALLGFVALLFSHFPPEGSRRANNYE